MREAMQAGAATGVERLFQAKAVLCDGAMGTMLYGCGVFINRCYDELNVTDPDLIRSVHMQYLQAGAEIIETNTFGANAIRLEHFGLRDRVRDFNRAGVALARQCVEAHREKQGAEAYVAGAVGSLGLVLHEADAAGRQKAYDTFREQIAVLLESGVDLLLFETMMSVAEAEIAAQAARDTAPGLKCVVLVTVDDHSVCLDGSTPEEFAERVSSLGVAAIGCNCSTGPQAVLEAIKRMRAHTDLPLVAMPNAGLPRNVEGRHIYLTSPEYMGSFAAKLIKAGASWVGGCCGTTPAHIRSMRGSLRALEAQDRGEQSRESGASKDAVPGQTARQRIEITPGEEEKAVAPPPLEERSALGRKIAAGEWVALVEIVPPKGFDCKRELDGATLLAARGVDAINVPDSPRASARMSAQTLCVQIQAKVGIETVLHYTCRDRNILSIQSDLLGAASIGLKNILCLTGDPPKMGSYPDATAVFDVDAIGLTRIVTNLNRGLDIGGNAVGGGSAGFTVAVAANPGVPDIDHEVRRFAAKVEAGGEYCITQPVFDLGLLEQFLRRIEGFRIPVIAGIWPLTSLRNAEFMKNDLKVSMPDEILDRMGRAPSKEAALAEGLAIAREMLAAVRGSVQGVQVSAPFAKFAAAADVLGLQATVREEVPVGA